MWKRNLLFLSLVGGGIVALGANLIPPRQAKTIASYDASSHRPADFHAAVERADASFHREWEDQGLRSAALAPDLAAARRLALGLMGTIPSVEEIRQFERLPADQRLAWWVDHILEDRRFADYFAERYARTFVGTEEGPFILYRRRRFVAWLADEFAKNRPYDKMVRELIAADGLWTDKPATNFVSVTIQPDNKNQPDPVRLAGRVTRAFLGLRLDCAQCHNHPFTEWKQSDFQGLSAFFGQTHLGFTGVHDGPGEYEVEDRKGEAKHLVAPRVPFAPDLLPDHGSERSKLAAWVTDAKNPFFARATVNRVWALMFGRPLIEPVDNLETDGPVPAALQLLADDFTAHDFDLRRLVRLIAATEVFQMDSATEHEIGKAEDHAWAAFPITRLRPEQVVGGVVQSSSVATINSESHILTRMIRYFNQNDFVRLYGDSGDDEFDGRVGTIPQRLLMMNDNLIEERIKDSPFNASTRIGMMAPDDAHAVEVAYLAVLTRRPTPEEAAHFERFLADPNVTRGQASSKEQGGPFKKLPADQVLTRGERLEDIYWSLLNSTEFSWNH
ncbi:MAG TPA: DUF1549 domain-containing protein [Gemmataceae bacterium]